MINSTYCTDLVLEIFSNDISSPLIFLLLEFGNNGNIKGLENRKYSNFASSINWLYYCGKLLISLDFNILIYKIMDYNIPCSILAPKISGRGLDQRREYTTSSPIPVFPRHFLRWMGRALALQQSEHSYS